MIKKSLMSGLIALLALSGCARENIGQSFANIPQTISRSSVSSTTGKFFNPKNSQLLKIKTVSNASTISSANISRKTVRAASVETGTNYRYNNRQWHIRKTAAEKAWGFSSGNKELIVAVIDSGVDYNHPDLKGRVIKGPDFADGDNDPMDDTSGHGTHVAGIIAANGGVKGIAPNVKIMALKVFPNDNERYKVYDSSEGIADAIIYAARNGASVINLSLGVDTFQNFGSPREIESAISEAVSMGVSVVTAAGNETYGFVSSQPSVQQNIYQIPVVATDERDKISSFSNYSNMDHPKTISAPGVNIFSTYPTSLVCSDKGCEMPYKYMDGTSMAAPVVAGTLALIRSAMYEDYLNVIREYQKNRPNLQPMSFQEFFHTRQKDATWWLGLTVSPAILAEHLMFSFTNKDNSYLQNSKSMSYGANRDAVFGYGIVDVGGAVEAASKVFSEVFL